MRIAAMKVLTPGSLPEALTLLAELGDQARPLAGGTDVMVRVKEGRWRVPHWINIRKLPELQGITVTDNVVQIGAAVTHARIQRSEILQREAPLLLKAAAGIGAAQIQAMGTLGGNLATGSPAGDTIPALYALEAELRLESVHGWRWVRIPDFFTGPGQTIRCSDELLTAVRFQAQPPDERSHFQKLGLRGAQAIALVSLAMRIRPDRQRPGALSFARLAYGAVGPTVLRAERAEEALVEAERLDEPTLQAIGALAAGAVNPISDLRASAEYRRAMAGALLRRGLAELLNMRGQVR